MNQLPIKQVQGYNLNEITNDIELDITSLNFQETNIDFQTTAKAQDFQNKAGAQTL